MQGELEVPVVTWLLTAERHGEATQTLFLPTEPHIPGAHSQPTSAFAEAAQFEGSSSLGIHRPNSVTHNCADLCKPL